MKTKKLANQLRLLSGNTLYSVILNERIGYQEIEDAFQASVDRSTRGKRYNDKTFMASGGMPPEGVSMLSR